VLNARGARAGRLFFGPFPKNGLCFNRDIPWPSLQFRLERGRRIGELELARPKCQLKKREAKMPKTDKPNILIIWEDDIGWFNVSVNNNGIMGYRTPNIDRVAKEGCNFTDWYGQQSSTAGRAAFITGQSPIRTGLIKVGLPGADLGLRPEDPTIGDVLKPLGYVCGQFGKNHLGDRDEFLPTVHGFDEFFGNLYHLNAEQEPENPDYPSDPEFKKKFGPRGVLRSWADVVRPGRLDTSHA
jgi:arylsulfatase